MFKIDEVVRKSARAVMLSASLLALAACQDDAVSQSARDEAAVTRAQTQFSQRVQGLLAEMTLEEKLGQLHQAAGGRLGRRVDRDGRTGNQPMSVPVAAVLMATLRSEVSWTRTC